MPAELNCVADAAIAKRGDALALDRLFIRTPVPMVLMRNDRQLHDANPAAQLYLRRRVGDLRRAPAGDLVPARQHAESDARWAALLRDQTVIGTIAVRTPDGQITTVHCAGVANILPGLHLVVGLPANLSLHDLVGTPQGSRATQPGRLRPREREILSLLARGHTLKEIAGELTLSHSTVRTHLRNAMSRLGARNRTQAFALALRVGEITLP